MKIELWGTYPPPVGGVSIHVLRLIHRIHNIDHSIQLRNLGKSKPEHSYIKNVKNIPFEFVKLLLARKKLIHLHSNNVFAFLLMVVFGRRHTIGVTLHNKRLIYEKSDWKLRIIRAFLRQVRFVILNDPDYKIQLADRFQIEKKKIFILPAFLPPLPEEEKRVHQSIIDFRKQHAFLISANAYKLRLSEGEDVYGFDLLIRLIASLREKEIDAGLVFCLPMIGDQDYYKKCLSQIEALGISKHILVVQEELTNGFEVWKLSDLFIRPTNTDIEGISVKEALYTGTHAIASDVCIRPKEALLFKNRDFEDLLDKVLYVFKHRGQILANTTSFTENSVSDILNIYNLWK